MLCFVLEKYPFKFALRLFTIRLVDFSNTYPLKSMAVSSGRGGEVDISDLLVLRMLWALYAKRNINIHTRACSKNSWSHKTKLGAKYKLLISQIKKKNHPSIRTSNRTIQINVRTFELFMFFVYLRISVHGDDFNVFVALFIYSVCLWSI